MRQEKVGPQRCRQGGRSTQRAVMRFLKLLQCFLMPAAPKGDAASCRWPRFRERRRLVQRSAPHPTLLHIPAPCWCSTTVALAQSAACSCTDRSCRGAPHHQGSGRSGVHGRPLRCRRAKGHARVVTEGGMHPLWAGMAAASQRSRGCSGTAACACARPAARYKLLKPGRNDAAAEPAPAPCSQGKPTLACTVSACS